MMSTGIQSVYTIPTRTRQFPVMTARTSSLPRHDRLQSNVTGARGMSWSGFGAEFLRSLG